MFTFILNARGHMKTSNFHVLLLRNASQVRPEVRAYIHKELCVMFTTMPYTLDPKFLGGTKKGTFEPVRFCFLAWIPLRLALCVFRLLKFTIAYLHDFEGTAQVFMLLSLYIGLKK